MNRDLIIGLLVSALGHFGFLYGSNLFKDKPKVVVQHEEEAVIELMEMPPVEPDEPEIVEVSDEPPADMSDLAPPSLADLPQTVQVDSFVQQIQPPPPPGLNRPTGVIEIPKTHGTGNFGKGMKDLFDLKNLDQVPSPRFQAKPNYPFEMRRAGITGEVLVGFIVDSNGAVRDAHAIRSTQREFEAAAIQAVSKWTFRPGRKGGRAVNTRMQVPIVFSITED